MFFKVRIEYLKERTLPEDIKKAGRYYKDTIDYVVESDNENEARGLTRCYFNNTHHSEISDLPMIISMTIIEKSDNKEALAGHQLDTIELWHGCGYKVCKI